MALTATSFHDAVPFKIVTDLSITTSALSVNVTGGPGRLFSVFVDNAKTGQPVYTKIYLYGGPVLTSTQPDLVLRTEANDAETYQIPYGVAFTELAFGCTADANPVSSTAPQGLCSISLTCS
jgi:hypothetical protein